MEEQREDPSKSGAKSKRSRPTKVLATDRIKFEKQLELLRAYASISGAERQPVTNKEVAEIVGIQESTVGLSNAFFSDVGLLVRTDEGFVPSQVVTAFAQASKWTPEKAAEKLAPLLRETWFAKALLTRLSLRPFSISEAIAKLAEICSADISYERNLRVLVDYLVASGLVRLEGDMLIVGLDHEDAPVEESELLARKDGEDREVKRDSASAINTQFSSPADGGVRFHIDVKVDMKEFSGWEATRISAFFNGIAAVLAAKGKIETDTTM
jgi:hypothetical protein